jgi:hypothetical protein
MHRHRDKFNLNLPGLGLTKMLLMALITVSVTRGTDLGVVKLFIDKYNFYISSNVQRDVIFSAER